jgi:pimeloyl-ACP methyl ester carboxylesterase
VRVDVAGVAVSFDVLSPQLVPSDLGWDDRPPAVVVGTAPARDAIALELVSAAQVLTLDGRGADADAATHAADLLGLLDALELDRPALVGVGAGAAIALAFVSRWPERTASVALVVEETDAGALEDVPATALVLAPADPLAGARLRSFVRG